MSIERTSCSFRQAGRLAGLALVAAGAVLGACRNELDGGNGAPSRVSGVRATAGVRSVTLRWEPVFGASRYEVAVARASLPGGEIRSSPVPQLVVDGLPAEESHDFTVFALTNDGRTSPASPVVSARPLAPSALSEHPAWTAEGEAANAFFGFSIRSAGDVNQDGFADVVIGSYAWSNPQINEGRVQVFHGSPDGLEATPAWSRESNGANVFFGHSAAGIGDFNGDGFDDLAVGAHGADPNGFADAGAVFLYLGTAGGLQPANAAWASLLGGQTGQQFGVWVGPAEKTDADGYADFLVSAWQSDNPQVNEGQLILYAGMAAPPTSASYSWYGEPDIAGGSLGVYSGEVMDVDGDGSLDVLGGAIGVASTMLFRGDGTPVAETFTQFLAGTGHRAGTAGDLDGDGREEVIASGITNGGQVHVLAWNDGTSVPESVWNVMGTPGLDEVGSAASTAGDVDGDGLDDVLVGNRGFDGTAGTNAGQVRLFLGSAGRPAAAAVWTAEGEGAGDFFGSEARGVGDVNADGFADVVVGAFTHGSGDQVQEGKAYLYLGGQPRSGPEVEIGFLVVGTAGSVRPTGAGFRDPFPGGGHRCVWSTNLGEIVAVETCSPSNVGAVVLTVPAGATEVRLVVIDVRDARAGEAVVLLP